MAEGEPGVTRKEQLVESIKLLPVIGNPLAYLIKYWGIKELIFLLAGFIVGWGIVYFGKSPEFVIAVYRVTQPPPKIEPKPDHIDYKVTENAPEWPQPYIFWLEQEGDDLKSQGLIQDYKMCFLNSKEIDPKSKANEWMFEKFTWELSTERDSEIKGYAFTLNKEDFSQLLASSKEKPASINFVVPAYQKGSKLFSIIRISWNQSNDPPSCESIRSVVK